MTRPTLPPEHHGFSPRALALRAGLAVGPVAIAALTGLLSPLSAGLLAAGVALGLLYAASLLLPPRAMQQVRAGIFALSLVRLAGLLIVTGGLTGWVPGKVFLVTGGFLGYLCFLYLEQLVLLLRATDTPPNPAWRTLVPGARKREDSPVRQR